MVLKTTCRLCLQVRWGVIFEVGRVIKAVFCWVRQGRIKGRNFIKGKEEEERNDYVCEDIGGSWSTYE